MPLQEDYRVSLDAFEGPLDLLLYLIRRVEVDVQDIPIARIADQYLAFLRQVDDIDVELAGDFLVMAATLIEIKSRTLMPPEDREPADQSESPKDGDSGAMHPADPRYELVQQLLAYQRYRIASEELDRRRLAFANRFPLRAGRRDLSELIDADADPVELELDDVHVMDLADAYERIMTSIDFTRIGDHVVELDDTPIALHQEDLLDRLRRSESGRLQLHEAFEGLGRGQRIGLFLATLELVKLDRVTVVQDDIEAPIELVLRSASDEIDPKPVDEPSGKEAEGAVDDDDRS
jgi:segregation and condensation protein A